MTLFYKEMKSPVGKLKLVASSKALVAVLPNRVKLDTMNLDPQHPMLIEAGRQLSEYFAGKRIQFDLPLQPDGTEFQKKVWRVLREIPFGKTKSYPDLALARPTLPELSELPTGRIRSLLSCPVIVSSVRTGCLPDLPAALRRKQRS